ncbi:MAG TPA: hypothetical protein VKZ63_19305 [Kofleriaceae bacterium]|nr:hypothetical protein [Kofleriaceae bacterium]
MRTGSRLAWMALAALLALAGCKEKQEGEVAELAKVLAGSAERVGTSGPWVKAAAGDRFRVGHAVRTSDDGGARIRFLAGGGLRMGPSTTIRFGPGKVAVDGELVAEENSIIDLEMGRAELTSGSVIRIDRTGGQVRFDVVVGQAVVTRDGERVELSAGQAIDVELGSARVTRVGGARAPADAGPPEGDAGSEEEADAGPPPPVAGAVTGTVRGRKARARAPGGGWDPLAPGEHELAPGTEVDVPRGATLVIARGEEQAEVRGAAQVVVVPTGDDGALVEARRGRAELRARAADVIVRVPGGVIVARRGKGSGSRADVAVDSRKAVVSVDSGTVDVIGNRGGKERLLLGQTGEIGRSGGIEVIGRPPDRAHFTIKAGLTATIHDPRPPSDVRVDFAAGCPGGGVLEVTRGRSFGDSLRRVPGERSAIVRLVSGSHRYRVRCMEDGVLADRAAASGRLRVKRDKGTKPLPRRAPANTVDTDGRLYTVLYQNLLPAITFRWPRAPEAATYTLVVAPERGQRIQVKSDQPRHAMKAGRLDEGTYQYWFTAGKTTSKKSTLRIAFDNAAASGYVQSPKPGTAWSGDTALVTGAVVEGWKVSVAGTPLPLDRQHRFSSTVTRQGDDTGLAIELRHPTRGVHLYVRKPR